LFPKSYFWVYFSDDGDGDDDEDGDDTFLSAVQARHYKEIEATEKRKVVQPKSFESVFKQRI